MKKLFAILLALSLVLILAACGRGETPGETTTPPEETETEEPETGAGESSTGEDQSQQAEGPGEVPEDMAGIIAYYNEALEKSEMQRTSYTREMTKITAYSKAIGITIIDDMNLHANPDVIPLSNITDTQVKASDLLKLKEEWVKEASSSVNGDEITLIIKMKSYDKDPAFDPSPADTGYVSILDNRTVIQLVIDVAMELSRTIAENVIKEAAASTYAFGISDGEYTVIIDADSGKIKSLLFTGQQFGESVAKCKVTIVPVSINVDVTIQGTLTAIYTPK